MHGGNISVRKAQTSIDFMMTYGLAIIILLLVAAGFFALDLLDASNFVGNKASGFSGVAVKGWSFTGNTGILSVKLTNQVGQRINITGVSATIGSENRVFDISSLPGELATGQSTDMIYSAAFTQQGAGGGYNAKLTINYINLQSNFAASSQGTLTGRVISSSTLVCSTPSASPVAGSYTSARSVALTTESGSTTYYTTNGDTPTNASEVYSGAITVPLDTSMTIKAYSVKSGYADSPLFSGTYVITHALATPSASPPAGEYNSSQNVTLTSEIGSTTYYTTNGDTPTNASAVYSNAINVPLGTNMTIKAYSAKSGYADSPTFSGNYSIANPPAPAPNSSVVLQMNFDADTDTVAYDSSIYHNNGSIADANHVSGKSGQALNFTGTGYVSMPNNASLNLRQNITLEAWVQWNVDPRTYYLSNTSSRGWAQIINKNGDNEWQLQHNTDNTLFEFALSVFNGTNTVRKYIQGTSAPQQGVWYHVVGTYDGQFMKLYVNGQNEKQVSMTGNISVSSSTVNIGRRFGSGSNYNDRYFNGLIDSVMIHNRSLTAGEIN